MERRARLFCCAPHLARCSWFVGIAWDAFIKRDEQEEGEGEKIEVKDELELSWNLLGIKLELPKRLTRGRHRLSYARNPHRCFTLQCSYGGKRLCDLQHSRVSARQNRCSSSQIFRGKIRFLMRKPPAKLRVLVPVGGGDGKGAVRDHCCNGDPNQAAPGAEEHAPRR